MSRKPLFIVWCKHSRRAETLATELGARVSFQYEMRLKGRWLTPLRYAVQCWKTWRLLEHEQPEVVIVQVPPVFALLIVVIWCKVPRKTTSSRVPYVIDCHTGTFCDPRWRWALPLQCWLSRGSLVSLVASEAALSVLQQWKVRGLFLIDGLPTLVPSASVIGLEGKKRVAVISGFGTDEPVTEIFASARLLPHVTFYFSGDAKRLPPKVVTQKPENVILTGFLQDNEYVGLLTNVQGVVDLTNEPTILTCGTYEALAVGKPAVVSDWPQIKRYFPLGFVHVNNTPEEIAAGIKRMLDEEIKLAAEVVIMRKELVTRRQPLLEELTALLKQ